MHRVDAKHAGVFGAVTGSDELIPSLGAEMLESSFDTIAIVIGLPLGFRKYIDPPG